MKVQITRKDNGIEVRECDNIGIERGIVVLYNWHDATPLSEVTYACTDWLECEVVDE